MANTEQVDKGRACDWPVTRRETLPNTVTGKPEETETTGPCGNRKRLYEVSYRMGDLSTKDDICERHLLDAWKKWNVDSAAPICGEGARP